MTLNLAMIRGRIDVGAEVVAGTLKFSLNVNPGFALNML